MPDPKTKTIAICNQKGGVTKTTTAVNLGVGLARQGKKVLIVDTDPQADATTCLGWPETDKLPITLAGLLEKSMNDEQLAPGEGILHHAEGVDLVPSGMELSGMELSLVTTMSREFALRDYLSQVKGGYDYVLIDTILRILKNELYLGYYVAKEVRSERIPELQIIDDAMFARAQAIVESRNTQWTAKQERSTAFRLSDYLLSGKLVCADCGGRLSTNTNTDRYTKRDGSESTKKTRRYICYHNTRSLRECHGQTSYIAEKIELAVMETLLEFFSQVQASPQEQLLESKYKRQQRAGREALRKHGKALEKLQHDLERLKGEVVNVLAGTSKFSEELLSGLIAEKETQIQQETAQAQALEAELNDRQAAMKSMNGQLAQFEGWAQEFALCSMERKQTIIFHLIDRIEVDRGYEITIHFSTVFEQFFGQEAVAA